MNQKETKNQTEGNVKAVPNVFISISHRESLLNRIDLLEKEYLEKLETQLDPVFFSGNGKKGFHLEKVFYPIRIDAGKYAFQSYAEQMELARQQKRPADGYSEPDVGAETVKENLQTAIRAHLHKLKEQPSSAERPHAEASDSGMGVDETDENLDAFANLYRKATGNISFKDISSGSISYSRHFLRALINQNDSLFLRSAGRLEEHLLKEDNLYDNGSLILPFQAPQSRIIVFANAGHGKTRLLHRIAMFFCHPQTGGKVIDAQTHLMMQNLYFPHAIKDLNRTWIPCVLHLRDTKDGVKSLDDAIVKAVCGVWRGKDGSVPHQMGEASVRVLIEIWRPRLLLLLDGLDELTNSARPVFLERLETYLRQNPATRVILSSRVAGLSDPSVEDKLVRMKFRGRSILPLSLEDVRRYSVLWIQLTQPREQQERLEDNVTQILYQKRYRYLREFMRTPLELLVILKRIVSDSLSLNRYQLFFDMLWEFCTRHIQNLNEKRQVFDDTMTLLSFFAYKMQFKNALYLTTTELTDLMDEIQELSFQTEIHSLEDVTDILQSLASNVGVIEVDTRHSEPAYTFPIRAYQEYLAAYACCHLILDPDGFAPDPYACIREHINDSRWEIVVQFVFSDLKNNKQSLFDDLLVKLFSSPVAGTEIISSIVEADLGINHYHAMELCRRFFSPAFLDDSRKELLYQCMGTRSSSSYVYALQSLYLMQPDALSYSGAYAMAEAVWEYQSGCSALKKAEAFLASDKPESVRLGAYMLVVLSQGCLKEALPLCETLIRKDLLISDGLVQRLLDRILADDSVSLYCVMALTHLWLTGQPGADIIRDEMTAERAESIVRMLRKELAARQTVIEKICLHHIGEVSFSDYSMLLHLVYALGSLPVTPRGLRTDKSDNLEVCAFLRALFAQSRKDVRFDQTAVAIACGFCCWDEGSLTEAWGNDILKNLPSEYVQKTLCSTREKKHFERIRELMSDYERQYFSQQPQNAVPSPQESYSPREIKHIEQLKGKMQNYEEAFSSEHKDALDEYDNCLTLFRNGDVNGALHYCLRTLEKEPLSSLNNLAFLLRYGKFNPSDLPDGQKYSVPELLLGGVVQGKAYPILNLALYRIEHERFHDACEMLKKLTAENWKEISSFWFADLWKPIRDPEGALVCVLAADYGSCSFDELEEMRELAQCVYAPFFDYLSCNGLGTESR